MTRLTWQGGDTKPAGMSGLPLSASDALRGPKALKANEVMLELLHNMPKDEGKFEVAKNKVLKNLAISRTSDRGLFFKRERLKKKGFKDDSLKKQVYESVKRMSLDELYDFFEAKIKNRTYSLGVIGNKKDFDYSTLAKDKKFKELSAESLFAPSESQN